MADRDQSTRTELHPLFSRRDFLKKAGLAVGAASAFYVVPSITTVKAAPAYEVITAVEDLPVTTVTGLGSSQLCIDSNRANVEFFWDQAGSAVGYIIIVWQGSVCDGQLFTTASIPSPTTTAVSIPLDEGAYAWRIDAYSGPNTIVAQSPCTQLTVDCEQAG